MTRALASGGIRTFGTSRRPCEELAALGVSVIEGTVLIRARALGNVKQLTFIAMPCHAAGIDMEDENAGSKITAALPAGTVIDTLMLVAGYFTTETFDELNFSEERRMMEICAFAPLRITQALVKAGALQAGSKIGMITSEGGSIGLRTEAEGGMHS